jgi:excisionase family DNA binding protein
MEKLGYSIEEAAESLGVGRTVMCDLIKTRRVQTVKIGRRRIVPGEALRAYMRELVAQQDTPASVI